RRRGRGPAGGDLVWSACRPPASVETVLVGPPGPQSMTTELLAKGCPELCRTCPVTSALPATWGLKEHAQTARKATREARRMTASYVALRPNGSRLSCGRDAWGRKPLERQIKRLVSEGTKFFPTCERRPPSSAC